MKTKALPALLALIGTLAILPGMVSAQRMDSNMPGMTPAKPNAATAEAQGTGIVKAIDTTKGTITLQH
ncbi:MAG TPA: hypothetical protein VGC19_09580 [Rhodanobacter sp.]